MSTKDEHEKGLSGLANLGNTCFINTCIQVLSHTHELNNFLEQDKDKYVNNFSFLKKWPSKKYDAVFLAVPHNNILARKLNSFLDLLKKQGILLDFKSVLPSHQKILKW